MKGVVINNPGCWDGNIMGTICQDKNGKYDNILIHMSGVGCTRGVRCVTLTAIYQ